MPTGSESLAGGHQLAMGEETVDQNGDGHVQGFEYQRSSESPGENG